jgi:putative ABC transport system permease protein
MLPKFKIPLAWLNLIDSKGRLFASLGGVAFAVVLMFVEMGFRNGLYDSETYVVQMMNADLVIVNRFKEAVVPKLPFPKSRIIQARAVPGVEAAYPLYVDEYRALWKNSRDRKEHPILVFAFDPNDPVFLIPEILQQSAKLKIEDTVLIDSKSREFYGDLVPNVRGEFSRHAVRVVGTFPMGPDFRVDGIIIGSDRTFFKDVADPRTPGATDAPRVDFGLLRVAPGYNPLAVRAEVRRALPDDVEVLTKQELSDRVKDYWANSKPVGYVFGMGTFVGFLIGVTICYQLLYNDIVDHMPQYATLKAIGYTNSYLTKIVLQEAVYLGVLGFVPGLVCSLAIYALLESASGILMRLTLFRVAAIFVLTLVMCILSGLIAIRKVINSDPAEVF